jgi:hypothetical protein
VQHEIKPKQDHVVFAVEKCRDRTAGQLAEKSGF